MNSLAYLGVFNIFAIPFIIYAHIKGECILLTQTLGGGAQSICDGVTNPFLNLVYINILFFLLSLVVYANSQVVSTPQHAKKPPGKH